MITRTINKILKSLNNLPAEYKVALARILTGMIEGIDYLNKYKVDKEEGKGLSTNDFTDELKIKLDGIEEKAQKNVKSDWNVTEGDAVILNKPNLEGYPDFAEWDSINHKIIFKHNNIVLPDMEIDGADFVKDGMIESVEIINGYLVITFNTEAGTEPISISLSDIFNPDNYYTKDDINNKFYTKEQIDNTRYTKQEVDNKFVEKVPGKQLSTEDYTNAEKTKLADIEEGAEKNVNADWNAEDGDAKILNKPSLQGYPDSAIWDEENKNIIFKHQGTILPQMTISGANFIKDGMVDDVKIENGNLIITFNTESGKQPISIPISDIFDANNYYTKQQTDDKFVEQVVGKQLSTEDFTTALKTKLENIKDFTVLEFYTGLTYESSIPNDIKEINDNSAKLLKTIVTNDAGDFINYKQCLLIIHNRSGILIPSTTIRNKLDFGNGDFIGVFTKNNYKIITDDNTVSAEFAIKLISFNYLSGQTYYYGTNNFSAIGGNIIKFTNWTTDSPKFIYQGGVSFKDTFTFDSNNNLINLIPIISLKSIQTALGQITNYTNEQIEQLIAEGHQVKVFKLNIAEDKALLQQILTDNPEDGSIDITSVMYFVYDSTKQKYYDVNNITIETVESDRQINITAAIGRYDYTAIKINTDEAAYIINPSHVESANADWNENDEDKAGYVKNRTHWKETEEVLDNIIKIYDNIEHTNEHLIAEYTPIEFKEAFAQIIYNKINNIQTFEDIVFPVGYFKPFGVDWQDYNLYSCIIHFNDIHSDSIVISIKYTENSDEVYQEYLIDNTLSIVDIKQQLENTIFISDNWNDNYGIITLPMADIEECICKKVITDIIHSLDSIYLEDLTDEEINQILE